MINFSDKKLAAFISLLSNGFLTALKFLVGIFGGSISLVSEGIHSLGDMIASIIALFSVIESDKPADNIHQFGHGKYEDMAGFIEACLVIFSALFILYIGFNKIITKNIHHNFEIGLSAAVMLFSVLLNFIVGKYLIKRGKETESNALIGDGIHIMADVYSSLGVFAGLIIINYTGHYILDPIIGIMIGTMILKTGLSLLKKTSDNLLDSSLPEENLNTIRNVLEEYKAHGLHGVKSIKTSKSGKIKNIWLTIYLKCTTTLKDTHKLCDSIENRLEAELKNTNVIIHAEPDCKEGETCPTCSEAIS